MTGNTLMKDKRKITSIWLQDESSWSISSCDEIFPYYEYETQAGGLFGDINRGSIWFAIFKDGQIVTRVNGRFVVNINYDLIKEIDYPD